MLKNQKQAHNLPLQSYKIDNSHLQTKINELEQLKSELRSTLSRNKQDHSALLNEISELKKENDVLRNQIVKLEFTKKSQATLIEQLEKKLEQRESTFYDCQIELQQEKAKRLQASRQLQHQLRQIKVDKEEIVNRYEQQLFKMSKVIQVNETNELKQILNKVNSNHEIQYHKILPRESIKVKRIKKASVQSLPNNNSGIRQKYWMKNSIPEKQEDNSLISQDVYLEMIRYVYRQLAKIQIKSKDIHKIPIISSFSQLRFPTSNDVHRFFSNYPFEIMDKLKVNLIHEFIVKQIERKGYQTTGKEIIKEITNSLQEIECEKEMSLASGNSSATYLDDSSPSVGIKNEGPRRISKPQIMAALEYVGMSKGTIQEESSMQSAGSQLV